MATVDLDAVRAALAVATPEVLDPDMVTADAHLIAHAPEWLAALADEVEMLRAKAEPKCACPWVDPKYWTTHYGAIDPASTQEYEPTCPVHGELRAEVESLREKLARVEALADDYQHLSPGGFHGADAARELRDALTD
ncbi:hypothetical protein ACQCX2_07690 [Propionibacteriaceae bacterium Y1700]|uniref:hypothetical protein n=1 Tax=Microlunatus sp. Y1700 TaxID=3418487 RepID=UPI003DA79FE3